MLVCTRCRNVGIETDGVVYERDHNGQWVVSQKRFDFPAGGICNECLLKEDEAFTEWEEAMEEETDDDQPVRIKSETMTDIIVLAIIPSVSLIVGLLAIKWIAIEERR